MANIFNTPLTQQFIIIARFINQYLNSFEKGLAKIDQKLNLSFTVNVTIEEPSISNY